jgi:hypothetical protein
MTLTDLDIDTEDTKADRIFERKSKENMMTHRRRRTLE